MPEVATLTERWAKKRLFGSGYAGLGSGNEALGTRLYLQHLSSTWMSRRPMATP
jgi:hypothetical protein